MKSSRIKTVRSLRPVAGRGTLGPLRPGLLREANAWEILRLVRQHAPCSRADLVRYSGLSAPTVSSAIEYLRRQRLVEPLGLGASSGGRPPGLLRFNSGYGSVVGADIGGTRVRVALADMEGRILGKWAASTRSQRTPVGIVGLIRRGLRELQRQHKVPTEKLLALAAGAPGVTDARAGIVFSAPHLSKWHNVPLRQLLQAKVKLPTAVENDVNLGALGEAWCGAAREVQNFVFLAIGTGIGAGIFLNGRLYHGSDWAAGEVGYMHVPGTPASPLAMDRPGALESVIGGHGVERAWQSRQNGRTASAPPHALRATEIFDQAQAGHPVARSILQNTSRILADAIVNISVMLNPSLVVFGGGIGSSVPLFETTRRILGRNEFARPRLAISLLGPDAQLFGAVRLALDLAEERLMAGH